MGLKTLFVHLFFQGEDEQCCISNLDPALVCLSRNGRYELLSEVEILSNTSVLIAKGTWRDEDFTILREKFKAVLPSCVANIALQEVDMGSVKLDSSCDFIDLRELFNFCVNLVVVRLPDATHFKGKVGFRSTFRGCGKLRELYNLATYRQISDFRGTFCYCAVLSNLELCANPLPRVDSETFQKVNRDLRIQLSADAHVPSDWSQLDPENIVFKK